MSLRLCADNPWWLFKNQLTLSCCYRLVSQSCPTLCDPISCSPAASSVHGIFQAWILEWVAISFSRESSWCRDWTQVSRITGRYFIVWATREAQVPQSPEYYLCGTDDGFYCGKQHLRWPCDAHHLVVYDPLLLSMIWYHSSDYGI